MPDAVIVSVARSPIERATNLFVSAGVETVSRRRRRPS
jgi:hypothetical protein